MMGDNKNFILAIVLSFVVLMGWQYFVAGPQIEAQRADQEEAAARGEAEPAPGAVPTPDVPADSTAAPAAPGEEAAPLPADEPAPVAAGRIDIETPSITGSINLAGARIDDVRLKDYRETVEEDSGIITLFSPADTARPYYADFGWVAGGDVPMPGPDTVWEAPAGVTLTPDAPLTLTWDNGAGLTFTRTITVDDHYMFAIEDSVANAAGGDVVVYPYGLIVRQGTPESQGMFILHEGLIAVLGDDGLNEIGYSQVRDDRSITPARAGSGWLGITDKYWAATLIPGEGSFQPRFTYSEPEGVETYQTDFLGDPVTISAGGEASYTTNLFAGAKEVELIDGYGEALSIQQFDLLIDWGWFYFLTKPMFFVIDWLYRLIGNFGVAILAVTVLIKLVFFPLANKSYKSMARMKAVQPQMMEIRDKHKDDKQKQQQALMELYKSEKINPLAGCLPILVQIPVFFALYKVLYVTIEMRHAPFFGWIQDLSAPDPTTIFNLFGLIPWSPPLFLMIGIWPILMGITMFLQMKLNPTPPDPTQAMIFNWMPVVFTFMLATFPAGLVIYWAWNNFLSILQQAYIMHRQGVKIELWDNIRGMFKKKPADAKS